LIQLVNYYVMRLIFQYAGATRANQLIALMVKQALADDMGTVLMNSFNINTAVGAQLDILGKYIGTSRNVGPTTSAPLYGFIRYAGGGNTNGMQRYAGGLNLGVAWSRYAGAGQQATALSDVSYRALLKFQIVVNSNNGTYASIVALLNQFFPDQVTVVDNLNMTLTYTVSPSVPLPVSTLDEFLPAPMGVGITVSAIGTGSDRVTSDGSLRITSDGSFRVVFNPTP
jgi:hypothetical protein